MPPRYAKTLYLDLNANPGQVEGNDRKPNPCKEEGTTVTPIIPQATDKFQTSIKVAGLTVAPGVMTGGNAPDETVVALSGTGLRISFSPAEACSLAAALQAVAVHLMESEQTERKAA